MAENEIFLNIKNKYLYCYHETEDTFCTEAEPEKKIKTYIEAFPKNYYIEAYLVGQKVENILSADLSNTGLVENPKDYTIEKKILIGGNFCVFEIMNGSYMYSCDHDTDLFIFKDPKTDLKYKKIHDFIVNKKNKINEIINLTYKLTLFGPMFIFFLFLISFFSIKTAYKYIITEKISDKTESHNHK